VKKLNTFSFKIFCVRQSWLVANSVHTVLSCPCRWCEIDIT